MSQRRIIATLITATVCAGRFAGLASLGYRPEGPCRGRSGRGLVVVAVIAGLLAAPGVCQAVAVPDSLSGLNWAKQAPQASPPANEGTVMAYDAATRTVVLFGDSFRDTWTWNGSAWTQQHPSASPPGTTDVSLAYDAATGKVVLFGGGNGRETWAWNGSTWTQRHPATHPPVLVGSSMAYDAATRTVVLFGRRNHASETWVWNGSTWAQQAPATSPPARVWASMAYDAATGTVVLFGGEINFGPNADGDTWAWNGSTWTHQQAPVASPSARWFASMAYDAATRALVLFGGFNNDQGYLNDTWVWNGTTWAQQHPATSPPTRAGASMAYDAATRTVVLFGGVNGKSLEDTWTWGSS